MRNGSIHKILRIGRTRDTAKEQALTPIKLLSEIAIRQFIRRVAAELYTFNFLWRNRYQNLFKNKNASEGL